MSIEWRFELPIFLRVYFIYLPMIIDYNSTHTLQEKHRTDWNKIAYDLSTCANQVSYYATHYYELLCNTSTSLRGVLWVIFTYYYYLIWSITNPLYIY